MKRSIHSYRVLYSIKKYDSPIHIYEWTELNNLQFKIHFKEHFWGD